jgi:hypothetical protein
LTKSKKLTPEPDIFYPAYFLLRNNNAVKTGDLARQNGKLAHYLFNLLNYISLSRFSNMNFDRTFFVRVKRGFFCYALSQSAGQPQKT